MATKTTVYGKTLTLTIGGTQIDNLLTNGLTQTRDTRETTTKDSNDEEEHRPTIKRRMLPFTGLYTEAATVGPVDLQNAYDNGTVLSWVYGTGVGGTHKWSGSGTVTKLDFEAPHDGNVGFSGEIKPTGPVTFATY